MALDRVPLRQRAATLAGAGQEPLTDKEQKELNEDLQETLRNELGIELGEGNTLPAGDPPRIFVTGKDKDGREVLRAPAEAGFPIGSPEFWQQVRMGNVFAYPAGEKAPVQLGAAENRIGKMSLAASEPVTPETFPQPAVRPLTGLRKWLRRLTFGLMYRKEARAIRQARASHSRFVEALRGHGPGRETAITAEKKRLEEIREQQREKVRRRRMKGLVDSENIAVQKKEHGLRNHLSIFKAEPELLPELEKKDGKQGIYTKDHFKDLTVFSKSAPAPDPESGKQHAHEVFDQQAIKIGNTGKALTDEEFAAVAIYAAMDPEVTFKAWQKKPDHDPTLEQALRDVGFSGREVASIIGSSIQTMGTTDNFDEHGRDSEGAYFKDITNVGRKKAADAFRAYGKGDIKPLAKLLGEAVNLGTSAFHSFNGTKLEYKATDC